MPSGKRKDKHVEIELHPVESSNIEAVGHDPATNTLRIRFKSGGTYDYADVTAKKHQEMLSAESLGQHFHRQIRGRHKFTKLKA